MSDQADIVEIYDLLYHLGFSANNTAFFHLSYAVFLASLNPQWLDPSSWRLYREVAKQYHTTPLRIYWEIGTIARRFWTQSPDLLCILARRTISAAPAPWELLQILAAYVKGK